MSAERPTVWTASGSEGRMRPRCPRAPSFGCTHRPPAAISAALVGEVLHLCHTCGTMPSKNPRLSVVLTPSLAALLAQLAEETGESASSLVRDLLTQSEGALQRMLQLVVAAKAAKGQIGGGLAASMDRVVRDLETAQRLVDNRSEDMLGDLVAMAETVRPRRRAPIPGAPSARDGGVPEGGSTPVPVTRGSGLPQRTKKGGNRGGV